VDSFVKGYTLKDTETWLYKIAQRNNIIYYNYGINGNDLNGENGVALRFSDMIDELDYIVVLMGHNDANPDLHNGIAVSIGLDEDTALFTFKGVLNILINGLLNKYHMSKILFLSSFNRKGIELPYVEAIGEICEKYSVNFYNNYKSSRVAFKIILS